jgi:hypothetical protein
MCLLKIINQLWRYLVITVPFKLFWVRSFTPDNLMSKHFFHHKGYGRGENKLEWLSQDNFFQTNLIYLEKVRSLVIKLGIIIRW